MMPRIGERREIAVVASGVQIVVIATTRECGSRSRSRSRSRGLAPPHRQVCRCCLRVADHRWCRRAQLDHRGGSQHIRPLLSGNTLLLTCAVGWRGSLVRGRVPFAVSMSRPNPCRLALSVCCGLNRRPVDSRPLRAAWRPAPPLFSKRARVLRRVLPRSSASPLRSVS